MAAGSSSFTNPSDGRHGSHYPQTLIVSWGDYDIPNNRTYVWITYQRSTDNQSSYYNYGYANPSQISIDGSQVASATPYSAHNTQVTQTLCTWEGWINHNNDGTKSISVSASFTSSSANLSSGSISGTVALPTIPRASGISATSVDIGSNTTISINRASSSFTHTITYSFGSLSGTIATKTSNTSINWEVPSSFYAQIPNAKYGTCTLTCTTYSGDTQIGSSTTTFRATANENLCKPTVSGTVQDINQTTIALTGESSKLVKYKSTAQVSTSISARNSATITKVTLNGAIFDGTPISNVETGTFEIVATDSRGYSTPLTITIPIVDYIPLSATSSFKRDSNTSDDVTLTYSGNYFDDDFGEESNTLSLSYKYREKGSSTWIDGTTILNPTITDNTFNETIQLGEAFDYRKNWEFSLYYADELANGNTGINDVLKGNGALEIYGSAIKIFGTNLFEFIYPVGSIYISTSSTNPNTLFGVGTWEAFGTGRTLVGIDTNQTEFDTVEETGGEKNHTLTIDEMPSHNHTQAGHSHNVWTNYISGSDSSYASTADNGNGSNNFWRSGYTDTQTPTINNTGGSQAHNNLQPYITVYMWKRVS